MFLQKSFLIGKILLLLQYIFQIIKNQAFMKQALITLVVVVLGVIIANKVAKAVPSLA